MKRIANWLLLIAAFAGGCLLFTSCQQKIDGEWYYKYPNSSSTRKFEISGDYIYYPEMGKEAPAFQRINGVYRALNYGPMTEEDISANRPHKIVTNTRTWTFSYEKDGTLILTNEDFTLDGNKKETYICYPQGKSTTQSSDYVSK